METSVREEGWITVAGIPTHVCTWGKWITGSSVQPDDKSKNVGTDDRNAVVLLISGNPGVIKYYQTFLFELYKKLMIPVWILSHAGHEIPPKDRKDMPSLSDNKELYNVTSQVAHKAEFIRDYIPPDTDIYIIAHSFGAKVTIELLKQELLRKQIKKCYLVFPTLERIGETPNGKFIQFVIKYLFSVTLLFTFVFSLFPYFLKWWLIRIYFILNGRFFFPPNCIDATIDLVRPSVIRNVFNLVVDEVEKIKSLDKEVIEECVDKLQVFFGANDGWAPVEYHKNLIQEVPKVDSRVLDSKYEHCFVLESATEFASELSEFIKSDLT